MGGCRAPVAGLMAHGLMSTQACTGIAVCVAPVFLHLHLSAPAMFAR